MHTNDTIIIGGGQAGLALSRCLTDRGRDHIIVERGRTAERWRSERWDSLRLLTPNWMTRLPGYSYAGDDPAGFMTASEVTDFFAGYATSFDAPVLEHTNVRALAHHGQGFLVTTDNGSFRSRNVVIAAGWCDRAAVPSAARHLSVHIRQVNPSAYRRPGDLPGGGVLVVGASATGVQLAHELHLSGRPVTLAVGSHSRMPRTYRGMDTFWWLDQIGALDQTIDEIGNEAVARNEPSSQLVGRPDRSTIDLGTLQSVGVRLVGRVNGIDERRVSLDTGVAARIASADTKMRRVLDRIDDAVERLGLGSEVLPAEPIPTIEVDDIPDEIHLDREGIDSVVWATGYTRPYDWLRLPILDAHGEIRQRRGVTSFPGAYVLGQRFQHYRNSNFIDGVGRDATFVADHICNRFSARRPHPGPVPRKALSTEAFCAAPTAENDHAVG